MKSRDWPFKTVEIQCDHCGRFGRFRKKMFVGIVGAETDLPTARRKIAIDCPVWRQNLNLAIISSIQQLNPFSSQDIYKTKGESVKRLKRNDGP